MINFFNYIYDINLILIITLSIILCIYKPSKIKTILYLILIESFFLFIYSSRYGIGFDYFNYYHLFMICKHLSFSDIFLFQGPCEPGFALILKLISFITTDIVIMYLIIGIIIFSVLMLYIYKYSPIPWLSVYLFVTLGFMFGILNLLRQYFAAIIFLFAIHFIQEKKLIPYLLIGLICLSIHKSALLILPVFFIARFNINRKTLIFYSSFTLLAYIFCDYTINFITRFVYQSYNLKTGELKNFMAGMPWIFVFIPFIYCLSAILMKNKLLEHNPKNIVLINFSIYTLFFWILLTKHLLIERPANFLYISSIILIPEMISCLNPYQLKLSQISKLNISISKMKKNGISGKQLENKQYELKQSQENYNEKKSYYITSIILVLFIGFLNQIFAISHGNHKVFPYRSIFTEKRNFEIENYIKRISNNH